jgi:hypothetical protein
MMSRAPRRGHVLDHLAQITLPVEQGVDLGTDLVGGRYSN